MQCVKLWVFVDWTRNSCNFTSCCAMSPAWITSIVQRTIWYGVGCVQCNQMIESCTHVDLSNQKIKKNYTISRGGAEIGTESVLLNRDYWLRIDTKGEKRRQFWCCCRWRPLKCHCFLFVHSEVVVIVENVVCWSRDALCECVCAQKSMQCTACRVIFTFFL